MQAEGAPALLAVEMGMPVFIGRAVCIAVAQLILHGSAAVLDGMYEMVLVEEGQGAEYGAPLSGDLTLLQVLERKGMAGTFQLTIDQEAHGRGLDAMRLH